MEKTIFEKIIDKELEADIIYEDDKIIAFNDIAPIAPTHILIVPKKKISSINDLEKEDKELIYKITKALWNKESRKLMDVGHAKGKTITPDTALSGVGVPLHPGAERFYKEAGLIK